ncbi:hypothetical protein U91I_00599 [alpha proteobacterium U9-1i]|nr:hypothetical protein U91I_00599 [alpha proteobacterium U9-1i]
MIGTLTPGEWVHVETVETRLVPQPGVMREDTPNIPAGEVFYSVHDVGEALLLVWLRGEYGIVEYEDQDKIDWRRTDVPEALNETLGTWARVTRENDHTGWVLVVYGQFECLGSLAGDEGCRD